MNCCKFERRLQHLLDERKDLSLGAGALPVQMQKHADDCTDCMELLAGYRALLGALHGGRSETSAFSAANLIGQNTATLRPVRWFRALGPLVTAASLLFTAWAVYQREPAQTDQQARLPLLVETTRAAATPATTMPVATLPAVALPPQTLAVAIPSNRAQAVRITSPIGLDERSLGLVLNLAGLSPVTFSADLLDSPLVEKPWWIMQVSDGLKPVTERMTGTLNALWQVLPGTGTPQEESQGARYDAYNRYDQVA